MSQLSCHVGDWKLLFDSPPRGKSGMVRVTVGTGKTYEVRFRRDADGIWIELPSGVYGFDLQAERDEEGRTQYRVITRNGHREWENVQVLRSGDAQTSAGGDGKKKGARIRAQMPGKIIRVTCKEGQIVAQGDPLLVMEAMKMENEIRASVSGKVSKLSVAEGHAVETGADLCRIDPV